MKDLDIRIALRADLQLRHGEDRSTVIIEELGLCERSARVDLAVVNGSLNAFEIKSERDSLDRLPTQIAVYSRVFDTVTIVAGTCHVRAAVRMVPKWWGVIEASEALGGIALQAKREPVSNPEVDVSALVQLLWRDEALGVLEARGLAKGLRTKRRAVLWQRLSDRVPFPEIALAVRERIKARGNWRDLEQRT